MLAVSVWEDSPPRKSAVTGAQHYRNELAQYSMNCDSMSQLLALLVISALQ